MMAPTRDFGRGARVTPARLSFLLAALLIPSGAARAQHSSGSTAAAMAGAAIGATSGTVLGLIGGFGPCNLTLWGVGCVRVAAAVGGTVGLVSGAWLGTEDSEAVRDRWRGAGYGAALGGLVGYGLSRGVRQYGWADAGAFLLVGAGIGASPVGSVLGFAAGAAAGTLGWVVIPGMKFGDVVGVSLVGLAAGGLAGWVLGPASGEEPIPLVIPLQIRF